MGIFLNWTDQRTHLLSVAPHSLDSHLPSLAEYRGIVEEAVFDRLGRPSFFDGAVDPILGRVAARVEDDQNSETANGKSTSCAFAPQMSSIRELAQAEAVRLKREIELRFVKTGCLEMPESEPK